MSDLIAAPDPQGRPPIRGPAANPTHTQATPSPAASHASLPCGPGTEEPAGETAPEQQPPTEGPRLQQPARGRRLVKKDEPPAPPLTPEQRLLLLDTWPQRPAGRRLRRPGRPVQAHPVRLEEASSTSEGPAGLMDQPRGGPRGSRLPELTRRTILMLKQANPDWGCQRISDMLLRGPGPAGQPRRRGPGAARGRLRDCEEVPTRPHPDKVRSLRACPAQPALADRPVHLRPQAAEPPRLPGGLHGRSQPLHRRLRPARQPVDGPGAGGVPARRWPATARPRRS